MGRVEASSAQVSFDRDVLVVAAGEQLGCRGTHLAGCGMRLLAPTAIGVGARVRVLFALARDSMVEIEGVLMCDEPRGTREDGKDGGRVWWLHFVDPPAWLDSFVGERLAAVAETDRQNDERGPCAGPLPAGPRPRQRSGAYRRAIKPGDAAARADAALRQVQTKEVNTGSQTEQLQTGRPQTGRPQTGRPQTGPRLASVHHVPFATSPVQPTFGAPRLTSTRQRQRGVRELREPDLLALYCEAMREVDAKGQE